MLQLAVIVTGFAVQILAWRLVVARRFTVWTLIVPVFAVLGGAAILVRPQTSGRISVGLVVPVSVAAGAALYLATIAFVGSASRWEVFRAHVVDRYARVGDVPIWAALTMSILLAVPGEELFWRGLAQPRLQASMPVLSGPALAWLAYVGANAASESLPFVAGAAVGGAVWATLAVWTEGVLASLICHVVWNGLMLVRPPAVARGMMPS